MSKLVINPESMDVLVGKVLGALDSGEWELPQEWADRVEEYAAATAENFIKEHQELNRLENAKAADVYKGEQSQRSETPIMDYVRYVKATRDGDRKTIAELEAKDFVVGTGSEGGNLAPTEFQQTLIDLVVKDSGAASYLRRVPMKTNALTMPTLTAGTTAYTIAESTNSGTSTQTTASYGTFGTVTLTAYKFGVYTKVSNELMEDSDPSVEAVIRADIARQLASYLDWSIFHGNSTAGADGTSSLFAGLESAITTNVFTAGGTTNFDSIVDLRTPEDNARGPIMMFTNPAVERELMKVKDNDGQYIYHPAVREGDVGLIWGMPLVKNNRISKTLGGGNDSCIFSGAFGTSGFLGVKSGVNLIVDPYTHGDYASTRIMAHVRFAFAVANENHFAILNGINLGA